VLDEEQPDPMVAAMTMVVKLTSTTGAMPSSQIMTPIRRR
jgi:hypothetical protein